MMVLFGMTALLCHASACQVAPGHSFQIKKQELQKLVTARIKPLVFVENTGILLLNRRTEDSLAQAPYFEASLLFKSTWLVPKPQLLSSDFGNRFYSDFNMFVAMMILALVKVIFITFLPFIFTFKLLSVFPLSIQFTMSYFHIENRCLFVH